MEESKMYVVGCSAMHETGLVQSLIHEVERVSRLYGGHGHSAEVLSVQVRMGALCPFSETHLLEHFRSFAQGTVAEGAKLIVERGTDPTDPLAQDVTLVSIEVEDILADEGGRGHVAKGNPHVRRETQDVSRNGKTKDEYERSGSNN